MEVKVKELVLQVTKNIDPDKLDLDRNFFKKSFIKNLNLFSRFK